ncbi:uncharacterized protein [Ptychodera flava]|uniref:uncharacterized protein n=1 Tax=Ptychodera flava TaxID=63121 RepID=UPI003969D518
MYKFYKCSTLTSVTIRHFYKNVTRRTERKSDDITWQHLLQFKPKHGWANHSQGTKAEFILLDKDQCNGQRVMRQITVDEDRSWSLKILNQQIRIENLKLPLSWTSCLNEIEFMFLVMANVDLCSGFKTLSAKETKNTAGDVTGRPEQWLTVQGHEMKHRSVGCSMILSMGVNNKMCKECATLKHNSGRSLSKPTKEVSLNSLKHKRESYMNREELLAKLDQERKSKKNAKRREETLRMKLQSEFQKFSIEDDRDFCTIFDAVSSDITDKWKDQEDMMILWDSQRKALQSKGPSDRRWHPKVIRVCLSTWTRSPKAYETLRKSGMLILPSGRLLKMYKNSVSQKAGFNDDVLEWMVAEAKKTLGPEGYDGGIIFDEMQIQEDLQLQHEGDETKLIGLVDLGDESDHMKQL